MRGVLEELQEKGVLVRFVQELFKDFDERAQRAADICNLWLYYTSSSLDVRSCSTYPGNVRFYAHLSTNDATLRANESAMVLSGHLGTRIRRLRYYQRLLPPLER